MGFDKPDLGFVVHLGAPPSPVAYYQQIGRAGRGVDRAEVIAAARPGGRATSGPTSARSRSRTEQSSGALSRPWPTAAGRCRLAALETRVDLSRSRLEMMLKVLDVDGAVRRVSGGWDGDRPALGVRRRTAMPG